MKSLVYDTLKRTPEVLDALLGHLPDEIIRWRPAPDRWSIFEVVAHLADMEVVALRFRAKKMAEEDNPVLPNIDQVSAVVEKEYAARSWRETLETFSEERMASLEWLRLLPEEALSRTGQHEEIGTLTLNNHLNQWAFHDLGHLRQIAELYRSAAFYPHTGNYHKYYSVAP